MIDCVCIFDIGPSSGGGTERVSSKRSGYQADPVKGDSVQSLIEFSTSEIESSNLSQLRPVIYHPLNCEHRDPETSGF